MTLFMIDTMMVILLLFGLRSVMKLREEMKEYRTIKNDLTSILRTLQTNMKTAEKTVHTLQEGIKYASVHITPHLPKASVLKDDLIFLLENGEKTADRLENLTRDMKKNYLTPQTVVFDPDPVPTQMIQESQVEKAPPASQKLKEHREEITRSVKKEPVLPRNIDDESREAVHKGFFTSIRRVR